MLLLAVSAMLSAVRPRMAPAIALAVGLPLPVVEIASGAGWAPLAALLFAGAGAVLGAAFGSLLRRSARAA